ncbi:hypothetical protein BUALT_Bualt07G0110400 [Buddleja alternifolia]|uniref:Uncharacterized protein n=1 Tax=Buddleja alternifolia TaxID=168488 RepID=A0AAV6XB53_9LAMI|nr:hypothetical protein BUALT_Bualt07G0110400 [Buddleja alternifolia]
MADGTRIIDHCMDVDGLKSSIERTEKSVEEIHHILAILTVTYQSQGVNEPGTSVEAGDDLQIPTKCSTMEFPLFNGEDSRGRVYRCKQFFEVDDTPPDSKEYLDKFDALMNCVDLFESYAISCFLGGIKHEISVLVCMFNPKSLQEAVSSEKLQEQANHISSKRYAQPVLPKFASNAQKPSITSPPARFTSSYSSPVYTNHLSSL